MIFRGELYGKEDYNNYYNTINTRNGCEFNNRAK